MNLLIVMPPEQICPRCERVHRNTGVKVFNAAQEVVWEGCINCWAKAFEAMPTVFELQRHLTECAALLTAYRDRCAELVSLGLRGLPTTEEVDAVIQKVQGRIG